MNLDEIGEMIDEYLKENDVVMRICFPKGSMDADILSPVPSPVFEFYLILHAMKKIFEKLLAMEAVDSSKKKIMLDAMLDLVKKEILKEEE